MCRTNFKIANLFQEEEGVGAVFADLDDDELDQDLQLRLNEPLCRR